MLHKPQLLIVDAPRQIEALCALLSCEGYQIVGVSSGEAALDAIRASAFPVLLADFHRLTLDGVELIREAQACDPEIVCIGMIGDGTVQNAVQAMTVGAFDFILKPFEVNSILPVLYRALYVHRLRAENARLQRRVADYVAELEAKNSALKALRFAHADGHSIARAQVDLSALVQEVLVELGDADQRPTIRIGALPPVYADAALLKQVFACLLSNALKSTALTAEAVVEVGSYQAQESCTFFVSDNGAGLDKKHAVRVFRASRRAHRHPEQESNDLALAKRIVETHGGRIWAKSKPGQGATFYFTLGKVVS